MIYALYTALLEHFYGRLSYILTKVTSSFLTTQLFAECEMFVRLRLTGTFLSLSDCCWPHWPELGPSPDPLMAAPGAVGAAVFWNMVMRPSSIVRRGLRRFLSSRRITAYSMRAANTKKMQTTR